MSENDYCPCRICKNITPMVGTRLCDECYELDRRIRMSPGRAQKILDQIREERAQQETNLHDNLLSLGVND